MTKRLRAPLVLLFLFLLTGIAYAGGSLIDPATNPVGFLDQLIAFSRSSWPIAVMLGAYALLELLSLLGKEGGRLAALGTGRISLVISGGLAVLAAALNALIAGGSPQTALIAAEVALLAFWHPKAVEVSKQVTRAALKGSGPTVVLAVLGLAAALSMACGAAKQHAGELAACTEDAAVKDLEPTVQSILLSGVSNWQAQLKALAVAFGGDELDCVVKFVKEIMASKMGAATDDATAAAIARANAWLAGHGQ